MKKLLALLLAIGISVANAAEFTMPNEGGGEIRLTTVACSDPSKFVVFAYGAQGKSIYGCWFHNNGLIHVRWDDGSTRIYQAKDFREVNTNNNKPKGTQL